MKKITVLLLLCILGGNLQAQEALPADGRWSLQEAVNYAWRHNIQVQQSQLQIESSEINYLQSKMERLPTLNGQASHSYAFGRSIDPFTNQFTTDPIRYNSFGLASSVAVFNGFAILNQIKSQYAVLEAAREEARSARNIVGLQVTDAYLQVLLAQELAEIARLQVLASEELLESTRIQVEAGALPQANLYDVESQLAADEVNAVTATNNLELAKLSLLQGLQLPSSQTIDVEPIAIDMTGLQLTTTSPEEIYLIALEAQPEIEAARSRLVAGKYDVLAAKGSLYPSLTLSGNLSTQYSSIGTERDFVTTLVEQELGFLRSDPTEAVIIRVPQSEAVVSEIPFMDQLDINRRENVSLNLNIPIFNNYRARARVGLAKIQAKNADLELDRAKNQLRVSIEQAYADARAAAKRYAALQKQVASLELTFENAETRRSVGAISTYDYTFAKNNLDRARAELLQAKYTYAFRLKVLDFYMGNPLSFE